MDHPEILVIFLLISTALPFLQVSYGFRSGDLLIDCGAKDETETNLNWITDVNFIETGRNKLLASSQSILEMKTLRYFPTGTRNCYNLTFDNDESEKYIFRAGFSYGNYDGFSSPPSFKLEIDGNAWANVTTSSGREPVYHELLYLIKDQQTSVCLVRTSNDDTPFISSLTAVSAAGNMYTFMKNVPLLHLHSRINYGANGSVEGSIGFQEEHFNRKWKSKEEMPDYLSIHDPRVSRSVDFEDVENSPPWLVMAYAVKAYATGPITLAIDFSDQNSVDAHFVLYFMDPIPPESEKITSKFEIYIDGSKMSVTDVPETNNYEVVVVSLSPVRVSGSANVTIAAAEGSTVTPFLNAMEVYYSEGKTNSSDANSGSPETDSSDAGVARNFSATLLIIFLHLFANFWF